MEGHNRLSSVDDAGHGVKMSQIKSILKPFRSSVSSRYSTWSAKTMSGSISLATVSTDVADVEEEIESKTFIYKHSEENIPAVKGEQEVIEEPEQHRSVFRRSTRMHKKKEEVIPEAIFIDPRYVLTPFEAIVAVSVLEDTLDELGIIKYMLPGASMVWAEGYKSINERFGVEPDKSRLFPEEGDKPVMTELTKVQCDRTCIEQILKNTVQGLVSAKSFEALVEAIDSAHRMYNEEALLILEQQEHAREIKELQEKISTTQKNSEKQLNLRSEIIMKLRDKMHDEMVKGQIRNRYVDNWESARQQQNNRMLGDAEDSLKNKLNSLQQELDEECRVNAEIENFLMQLHLDIEDGIDTWMRRYDVQVEEMDATLLKLKINREGLIEELEKLHDLYEARQREIDEYLEYKEMKRLEQEELDRLATYATRIQAWWRGHLVRSGWGKYRKLAQKMREIAIKYGHGPKKGKKGKGKGKKKGKK